MSELITLNEWNQAAEKGVTVVSMNELLNARHRERMAEVITERDDLRFVLDSQEPWNAKAQQLLDAGRWAGHTLIEGCVTELAETRAERDRLRAELHERTSEVDRLDHLQAKSQAEIERLKLDVAMMNGRLQERTETMLERQKAWSDRARKAEAVLGRGLPELKAAWPLVEDAEKEALQEGKLQRQAGSLVEAKRWDDVSRAFQQQALRIRGLIDEIEGLLGDGVDPIDGIDEGVLEEAQRNAEVQVHGLLMKKAKRLLGQATEALTACRRALVIPNHCADPTCEVPSCMARRAIEAIEKAGLLEKQEGGVA